MRFKIGVFVAVVLVLVTGLNVLPGAAQVTQTIVSDDFNGTVLNPAVWTFINPLGDASVILEGADTGEAVLNISIPSGVAHDIWEAGNRVPRVMQSAPNADFAIEVKFTSSVNQPFQMQGVLIEQDEFNLLRVDFYSEGANTRLFINANIDGQPMVPFITDQVVQSAGTTPLWVRIIRNGDDWRVQISLNGTGWQDAASFNHVLSVSNVGVFAANNVTTNSSSAPAHTVKVDYFANLLSPIEGEDATPTPTPTITPSPTETLTPTPTETPTPTVTPSPTLTDTPIVPTADPNATQAPTAVPQQPTAVPDDSTTQGTPTDAVPVANQPTRDPNATPFPTPAATDWSANDNGNDGGDNPPTATIPPTPTLITFDTIPPQIIDLLPVIGRNTIWLTWKTDEPANGRIEYGQTTAYALGILEIPDSTIQHTILLDDLDLGEEYNFQIVMEDAEGNVGFSGNQRITTSRTATEPTIDLWYGPEIVVGLNEVPQRWVNVLGNVTAPEGGVRSITYTLNGNAGTRGQITAGPDNLRLARLGDFNIDIPLEDLFAGENTVEITAEDSIGQRVTETVTIIYHTDIWVRNDLVTTTGACDLIPLYDSESESDLFSYTVDWSTADGIFELGQVIDGNWTLTEEGVRTVVPGYDRLIGLGSMEWLDYEILVPVMVNSIEPVGYDTAYGGPAVGILVRWQGHSNWRGRQPHMGWTPLGGIAWFVWQDQGPNGPLHPLGKHYQFMGGNGRALYRDESGLELLPGREYMMRVRVETVPEGTRYSMRTWDSNLEEPDTWIFSEIQTADVGLPNGSAVLLAHFVDATFGNVEVMPLIDGVPAPPATPENGEETAVTIDCSARAGRAINLRAGPGTQFDFRGVMLAGDTAQVNGQSVDDEGFVWWHLAIALPEEE